MGSNLTHASHRSTSGLLAIALGAATSAAIVGAALAGHRFGVLDVALVLVAAAVILGLNLRQDPQRGLLSALPSEWDEEVVVRAPRAAQLQDGDTGTGHAA